MTRDPKVTGEAKMTNEKIDGILAGEEELIPSSGFFSSVMQRIEDEAAAPPPIPFPWKRAVPGMALAAGVFGWGAVELVRMGVPAASHFSLPAIHATAAFTRPVEQAGWVALALAISVASWLLSKKMAGRSGPF
jgi:hypothetical protein